MAGERILIVDDSAINLKLIKYVLVDVGFDVDTAADAPQALAALRARRPRLILMDVQLPGMSGLELTRQLKADPETRDLIIVAVTASAMRGDEEKARDAGCDGYLSKPIDTEALPRVVAGYLSGAHG